MRAPDQFHPDKRSTYQAASLSVIALQNHIALPDSLDSLGVRVLSASRDGSSSEPRIEATVGEEGGGDLADEGLGVGLLRD